MIDDRKERFDPRSPVQPGRSPAPYFILAFLAAIVIWTLQQNLIFGSYSPKAEKPPPVSARQTIGKAASKGDIRTIFSADDYPASAQARGEEGTARARLTVDETGRVAACKIIHSTGSKSLDYTTCNVIERRARFTPAHDGHGKAVSSIVLTPPIRWQLEG